MALSLEERCTNAYLAWESYKGGGDQRSNDMYNAYEGLCEQVRAKQR